MARKKKHPEHVNLERWLVSYADFITLLFAFFTTLYAISVMDQNKAGKLMYSMRTAFNINLFKSNVDIHGSPLSQNPTLTIRPLMSLKTGHADEKKGRQGKATKFKQLETALEQLTKDPLLKGKVVVRREAHGIVVSLTEAGFFGSGSAEMDDAALVALSRVGETLAKASFEVVVEGHTDNVPVRGGSKYATNWELSSARATFVVAHFVDRLELPADRLSAAGYSEHRPVASNDTADGRNRNRRVDLVIRRPPELEAAGAAGPPPSDDAGRTMLANPVP